MDDLEPKSKRKKFKDSVIDGSYKATHYLSYHSYRRSQRVAKSLLICAVVFAVLSLIPILGVQGMTLNIMVFFMVAYLLFDYWITSKSTTMKKDSKTVVEQASAMAGVKTIKNGWHVYDGGYATDRDETLEISFVEERSFLNNVYQMKWQGKENFLNTKDSVDALKFFLLKQQENGGYAVYGTVDEEYAKYLQENGILLEELPRKFRNKPGRFDYAVATKDIKKALLEYPKTFEAYLFTVDVEQENDRLKKNAKQEQIRKEDNRSLINLEKLK